MLQPVIFPSHCPACGSPWKRNEGEAAYYCTNQATCPPQQTARIGHFSGHKAADIRLGAEPLISSSRTDSCIVSSTSIA